MDSMGMRPALEPSQIVQAVQHYFPSNFHGIDWIDDAVRVDRSPTVEARIRDAEACSMNALKGFGEGAHLSDFLAANHKSVRTVILANSPKFYAPLIDLQPGQLKWGEDAMLLDVGMVATSRLDYLEAVAVFGGEVHLMGIGLSPSEAALFLQKLGSSPTPPHSLHVYSRFYRENLGCELLLETIRTNGKIKALTVAYADLDFVDIQAPIPSLQALTLIGGQVGDKFFGQIGAHLHNWVSLMSLTFSHVQVGRTIEDEDEHVRTIEGKTLSKPRWQHSFNDFVRNDCHNLKHLALEGFSVNDLEFVHFVNLLETNSSLQSLSLARCSPSSDFLNRASVIACIVDAINKSELLHLDLNGTSLADDPTIEAHLAKKRGKQVLKSYEKVPATAVRLFICGDSYAGKTTLLSTLSNDHKKGSHLRWIIGCAIRSKNKRTRGIEVRKLVRDGIRVSAWDMAGQEEFHAFHDHIFPDMSAQGAPALFLFVWSPVDSKDDGKGEFKSADTFEASFRYWLKFIASNTRPSNVARKVIVVLTRKDQMNLVRDRISTHLSILQDIFKMVIEIASVCEVDSRNHSSVGVVASAIFECAKSVLKDVMIYKACDELSTHLTTLGLLILAWEDFQKLCSEKVNIFDAEHQTAIALSLHESGHLIYFRNMPFLILDNNWFCCKVMGELIHFSGLSAGAIPFSGFVPQQYLEKLLERGGLSNAKVSAGHLVNLMEAMHLCCKVPGDIHSNVFIPSTLPSHRIDSRQLCWRTSANNESANFFHAGRRLQCQDKVVNFLTPGIFPVIQVTFNKAFGKLGADIELHRHLISIYYQYMEIIVEFCKANGENVMDILVRSSYEVDPSLTLKVMEEKVVRAIVRMCAEPIGNQGVKLVQGVLRPKCLVLPALSHEREDQYVLAQQLKEDLKLQLQDRPQQTIFFHTWKRNRYFEAGADSIMDLLGMEGYFDVVKSYKTTLQEVAKEMVAACGHEQILLQDMSDLAMEATTSVSNIADGKRQVEVIREGLEDGEDVDTLCQDMATSILREIHAVKSKVDIIDTKLDGVGTNLAAMYVELQNLAMLQGRVLQQIQNSMKQLLFFGTEKEMGRVPRLGFLTTEGVGSRRRFVTSLSKDVRSVRIELFCEHKECPHKVEGQKGICVTTINEGAFKSALPYVNGFLKLLTMVARVGAHAVAGMGASVPDLSQIVALLMDTPGLLDSFDSVSGFMDATSSFNGWQQWLVHVLQQNGGMTEQNIFSKFKLRRALYQETSQVAWVCEIHYISQTPFPLS